MVRNAYSLRDQKSEAFHLPFFKQTHGEAERELRTLVNDGQSMLKHYPEDFDLYYIGSYDDSTGKFEPLDTPQHIVKAIQLVQPQN